MQKERRSSQLQPWGRVLVPPEGIYIMLSLSSSVGTKGPTLVEDGNFKLNTVNTRFLEHHPVTSPPANQKKVTHPAALTPNFAFRSFSLKTIREFRVFEHKTPILLAWPCNKPFSAPSSNVLVCLASLCVGHTNLGSVILTQHCKSTILKFKKKKKAHKFGLINARLNSKSFQNVDHGSGTSIYYNGSENSHMQKNNCRNTMLHLYTLIIFRDIYFN